jgi:hypothetical protein
LAAQLKCAQGARCFATPGYQGRGVHIAKLITTYTSDLGQDQTFSHAYQKNNTVLLDLRSLLPSERL